MAAETVRIKPATHAKLREIAAATGRTMPEVLEEAVEALRRQRILNATNEAYAKLKADPKAWAAELAEREAWDATTADGLGDK